MRTALRLGLPLLLVTAACGDDGVHHLADAPVHVDGAPDVDAPPDAPPVPQPVTLKITIVGAPQMGIPVYFQAPDGTSIATNMTDATGTASALMPAGGFVTVVDAYGADDTPPGPGSAALIGANEVHHVRTFAGVKAGDHLLLNERNAETGGIGINISLPDPADDATTELDVFTDCGGNEEEIDLDGEGSGGELKHAPRGFHRVSRLVNGGFNLFGCGATASFLVLEIQSVGEGTFHTLGSFLVPDVAISDDVTLDFSAKTFTTAVTTTTVFSNVPAAFANVELLTDFAVPGGVYQTGDFEDTDESASVDHDDGTATIVMARPSLTATRVDHARFTGETVQQHFYRWGAAPNGDGAFPFDLTGLPLASFATAPAMDLATDKVTWTAGADGATPNAVLVSIHEQRTIPEAPFAQWTWDIVAPYAAGVVAFPKLVGDAADFNPDTELDTNTSVRVIVANVPGGYDVVRARAFDLDPETDISELAAGASGHFEVATSDENPVLGPQLRKTAHPHRHRRAKRH